MTEKRSGLDPSLEPFARFSISVSILLEQFEI